MTAKPNATRNVLTPRGIDVLRHKLAEVSALARHYGFREVAFHLGVAEIALIDARETLVPYRGDLVAEVERPQPDILDA
jgi:hypothetical protein